jgi:ParB/RepB/Spo0J family partition protein
MTTKKNGVAPDATTIATVAESEVFVWIDPRRIDPSPFQHRSVFDAAEMDELKADIGKHGIHTPLIIRSHPQDLDKFELATGERRLRCAIDLGLPLVPAHIRPLTDRQVQELQWGENFRRVNPNPLDEAKGLNHLLAYHKKVDGLARYINKPRVYVLTRLQLLSLIDEIQEMTHAGVFNLRDSLEIACLEPKLQRTFFDEKCKGWKEKKGFRIHDLSWVLRSYRCDLTSAIFDGKDKDLDPEAGACTRCPFNSASYQSLFPEMAKRATCNRPECYAKKTEAHLRRTIRELNARHPLAAIVISGSLESTWERALAEIPESFAWPRYDMLDVCTVWPPKEPEHDEFEDEEMEGGFDDEGYAAAMEEYRADLREFQESLQQGRIHRVLYINGHHSEMKYIDPERPRSHQHADGPKAIPVSAAAVKTAIKAGTATLQLLQGEITRLRDREERSVELDQEKIQKEVHTQFNQRLTDPAAPATLTPGDQLGIRLLIYQSLDYQGREKLHELVSYEEESGDGRRMPLTDWLDALTEVQVALMTRIAIYHKTEALLPGKPTAMALLRISTDIGVDFPAIRAAQDKVAADRQQRMTDRITGLEAKIANLKEKVVEPVS